MVTAKNKFTRAFVKTKTVAEMERLIGGKLNSLPSFLKFQEEQKDGNGGLYNLEWKVRKYITTKERNGKQKC